MGIAIDHPPMSSSESRSVSMRPTAGWSRKDLNADRPAVPTARATLCTGLRRMTCGGALAAGLALGPSAADLLARAARDGGGATGGTKPGLALPTAWLHAANRFVRRWRRTTRLALVTVTNVRATRVPWPRVTVIRYAPGVTR